MLLHPGVLERLAAKYAEAPRYEYGFNYRKPSGEAVRYPSLSARQLDPSSWETNYATRKPGEAFRVGHTREKQVELPPSNASAIEADPQVTWRLSGDFGSPRVRPGFATPGMIGQSGSKKWDGQHWTTDRALQAPPFTNTDGTPVPRFLGPQAVGALKLPARAPGVPTTSPIPDTPFSSSEDGGPSITERLRRAVMTQTVGNFW